MMKRKAFSLIELIFVIIIIGILSKFGIDLMVQAYNNYIASKANHVLQSNSQMAVELISSKLQYRIKDSVIAKKDDNITFKALSNVLPTDVDYVALEWIGYDVEGMRGTQEPLWSGVIDVDNVNTTATNLVSPGTDTNALTTHIEAISNGLSDINQTALYFIGSNTDVMIDFGWSGNGAYLQDQNGSLHPVEVSGADSFAPLTGDFTNVRISEYYQLAWSAYAAVIENYNDITKSGDLVLYYNYQPWQGEQFSDFVSNTDTNGIRKTTIMENISTFRFSATGSVVKIQVCANSDLLEEYSICKEKVIF
jgi:prepilin-type N-terminal cleavage/methylation domain-containing protein